MMLSLQEVSREFEDLILFSNFSTTDSCEIENVFLCTPTISTISSSTVYLGEPARADRLLAVWDGRSCLNLVVANCQDPHLYDQLNLENINLVVCSVSLPELHNELLLCLNLHQKWEACLSTVPVREGSLGHLLATSVTLLDKKVSLYVLSPTFNLVDCCAVNKFSDKLIQRLQSKDNLLEKQAIFLTMDTGEEKAAIYSTEPIMDQDVLKGYLLIVRNQDIPIPKCIVRLLLRCIIDHMAGSAAFVPAEYQELISLLSDILLFTPQDVDPLYQRLKKLPHPLHPNMNMRFLLVSRGTGDAPLWSLAAELKTIFPNCNLTPYDRHVVVLLSGPELLSRPNFDPAALDAVLKKYGAHGVFSIPVRFIRGLRVAYLQAKEILRLLPSLNLTGGKFHGYVSELFEYYRVHLCVSYLDEFYGKNRLVYLVHPVVIALMRYDDANGTDFCDFAFAYAQNDCNIVKTADATQLHRNTVYNKLKRIKELFDIDLNDTSLQRELLFSSQVIHYARFNDSRKRDHLIFYQEPRYLSN